MTDKQIETSREIRLWITKVVFPVVGITMLVPSSRKFVVAKTKEIADKIKGKLHK